MQKLPLIFAFLFGGLAACAATPVDSPPSDPDPDPDPGPGPGPTGQSEIEIRHSGMLVVGNSFQCTGTWPSPLTPCGYTWSSQPQTAAIIDGSGVAHLVLRRIPIPIDGGASMVTIDLTFGAAGLTSASVREATTSAGTARQIERSEPISGWIDPVVMGAAVDARNAGRFSFTFTWGSISGTYDTSPP